MKRLVIFSLLVGLFAVGALRFHLVAQEPEEGEVSRAEVEQDFGSEASELAARIDAGDSDLLARFKKALASEAGQIVLRDRAGGYEDALREDARGDAISGFLEDHFVKEEGTYSLREGQGDFRSYLERTATSFNEDIESIRPVIQEHASRLATDTELERLVSRFLKHEAAPVILYVEELRQRLRPDIGLIERELGEIFVADENGNYVVRPSRRDDAQRFLESGQRVLKGIKHLKAELAEWSADIVAKDELHKTLKEGMRDPLFVAFVAAQLFDEEGGSFSERMNEFFDNMEEFTHDTGDGLEIVDEAREELEERVGHYQQLAFRVQKIRTPLKEFAAKLKTGDPLEDGWRELLQTDVACLKVSESLDIAGAKPEEAVKSLLGHIMQEDDNGQLRVMTEESEEEVASFIRENFRRFREVRRRGRVIDEIATEMDDPEVGKLLASMGGKFAILTAIQKHLRSQQFDGLALWIEDHFEATDSGLALREEAQPEIEEMLEQVQEVEKELANDDF